MTPTPYLKRFNTDGGTLYVFPSVSRDLTKTLMNKDYEFKFSHYACLNLPDIRSGKYSEDSEDMEKGLYIETLMNEGVSLWSNDSMQDAITLNLQNYVMNFETAILNGEGDNDDYDNDIPTTVSEKVFWNWLRKVGAIRFNEAGTLEEYDSIHDRTVQYIGNLDIMNTVEINGDVFDELYIHIPSTSGASTAVYFRPGEMTDNKNYLYKNYPVTNGDLNPEYIIGRGENDSNVYGWGDLKAMYDIDEGGNYYVGDYGHTIDFRDSSYDNGYGISNMNAKSLEDFEFNAVLIFYDMIEKTSTPGVRRVATNLYGILFLDQVTDMQDSSGKKGYIQRYPKKKETVYGNGNSYGLKIDLKVDTIGDNTWSYGVIAVPVAVPSGESGSTEYDAGDWGRERIVSMIHYTKALTELQKCIDLFFTQKDEMIKLSQRISDLENIVMGIDSVSSMKDDIRRLYDLCDGNAIVDTKPLLDLINENSDKLNGILRGDKNLKIQFDTDVIQPGNGIGIKKGLNKVVISSEQRYSINTVYDGNSTNEVIIGQNNPVKTYGDDLPVCHVPLLPGENFAVIYYRDTGDCNRNITINIDESDCNWEVGQSMKIYFIGDGGSLRFTDSMNTGIIVNPNSTVSLSIPGLEVEGNNFIEIVCIALAGTNDTGDVNEDKFIYLIK